MNKEYLEKELQTFIDKANFLRAELLRLDGIIIYLQNKIKELQKSDLTNS
jgi:hypothetical protein